MWMEHFAFECGIYLVLFDEYSKFEFLTALAYIKLIPSYLVICLCVASVVAYPCMRCLWLKYFKCNVMWGLFLSFSLKTFLLQSTSNMHCGFECRKCILYTAADSIACGNVFGDLEFDCCLEHVGRHVSMCLSAQMCFKALCQPFPSELLMV